MINVNSLRYTYPGESRPAIKAIDFQVKEGEVFGAQWGWQEYYSKGFDSAAHRAYRIGEGIR